MNSSDKILGMNIGNFWEWLQAVSDWVEVWFQSRDWTDVFGCCGVFLYHSNSVTNREGTKRLPVLYGSEIWAILCVIVGKINNMLLCVKIMFIYTCLTD